ncbi:MAG: NADH-ubiquinone oxidoreductase-F iron-sulfur binding region domain-containing protein [bacterium]|nr:NADH-ubiquinone oxidoreductase-F iron-sulfur binding region domain-containing protein [bacterium]
MDILSKIKQADLVGRGGACFSVAKKWEAVKNVISDKKYIICNASEGEPGIVKDGFIIEKYPERLIDGIKIAIDFLSLDSSKIKAYLYINNKYYKKYYKKLSQSIGNLPIEIFVKQSGAGYIGGEESSLLNAIEHKRIEPRLRPPFPTTSGLWGCPTLINNVETFYNVSLVNSGEYRNSRFYTIGGDCFNNGVYYLSDNFTIQEILEKTNNIPDFPFFVQVGGNASGEILNSSQLKESVGGAGSITIFSLEKYQNKKFIENLLEFFVNESCGKCTPCREGSFRLNEIIKSEKVDWQLFFDLIENLSETSFCGLGSALAAPIKSFIKNVYPQINEKY